MNLKFKRIHQNSLTENPIKEDFEKELKSETDKLSKTFLSSKLIVEEEEKDVERKKEKLKIKKVGLTSHNKKNLSIFCNYSSFLDAKVIIFLFRGLT